MQVRSSKLELGIHPGEPDHIALGAFRYRAFYLALLARSSCKQAATMKMICSEVLITLRPAADLGRKFYGAA